MRSPQVISHIPKKEWEEYTDLQVLKSAAGYYIGTVHHNPEGFDEPGSRDSDYYATKELAQADLDFKLWKQRWNP